MNVLLTLRMMPQREEPQPRKVLSNKDQVPQDPLGEQVTNVEFQIMIVMLDWAMTNQAGQAKAPLLQVPNVAARVRYFAHMNPLEFHVSKVYKDIKEFIDEIHKDLAIMGLYSEEKAELSTYQRNGVAQVWFTKQVSNRVDEG